jgi:hypothetical protein
MWSQITKYRKAAVAVVTQALTFATLFYGSNHYVSMAVALAGALGVYAVPNETPAAPQPPAAAAPPAVTAPAAVRAGPPPLPPEGT